VLRVAWLQIDHASGIDLRRTQKVQDCFGTVAVRVDERQAYILRDHLAQAELKEFGFAAASAPGNEHVALKILFAKPEWDRMCSQNLARTQKR
jgi:hypothetical protein